MTIAPQVVGSPAVGESNNTVATSLVIPKPSTGVTVQDGDILVAVLRCGSSAQTTDYSRAGWTRRGLAFSSSSAGLRVTGIFTHYVTSSAGEPSSYTFTLASNAFARQAGMIFVVRPGVGAAPWGSEPTYAQATTVSGTTPAYAPSAGTLTVTAESLAIYAKANELVSPNATAWTAPTGSTSIGVHGSLTSQADTSATRSVVGAAYEEITGTTAGGSTRAGAWAAYSSDVTCLIAIPGTAPGVTRVTKTAATSWDVAARVSKTSAASYDVATRAAKTAAASYDVAARVAKTSGTSYDVAARVTATSATTWDTAGSLTRVTKTSATSWDTVGRVAKTAAITYDVAARAAKTAATSWDVLTRAAKTSSTAFDVASRVAKTSATSWDSRARVTRTTATSWDTAGPATALSAWLARPGPKWCAHRNGFKDTYGEFTLEGFTALKAWNPFVAWNIDVVRTSDGEFVASHDLTTGRVLSGTSLTISSSTWASISGKTTLVGGNAVTRLDDIVAIAPAGTVFFIDNKANTNQSALATKLAALGLSPANVVYKIGATSTANFTSARANGYTTWAYGFDSDTSTLMGELSSIDWMGFDYAGTQANWTTLIGSGKPMLAHILATLTDKGTADSKAATAGGSNFGYMVTDVAAIVPDRVTKTHTTTWDTRVRPTPKASATSWDVRSRAAKTHSSSWDLYTRAVKTTAASWDVRSRAALTSSTSWDVASRSAKSIATTWDVRGRGSKTLPATWDTAAALTRVSTTCATSWDLRQRSGATSATSWDLRSRVAGARPTTWDVLTRGLEMVAVSWDVAFLPPPGDGSPVLVPRARIHTTTRRAAITTTTNRAALTGG